MICSIYTMHDRFNFNLMSIYFLLHRLYRLRDSLFRFLYTVVLRNDLNLNKYRQQPRFRLKVFTKELFSFWTICKCVELPLLWIWIACRLIRDSKLSRINGQAWYWTSAQYLWQWSAVSEEIIVTLLEFDKWYRTYIQINRGSWNNVRK